MLYCLFQTLYCNISQKPHITFVSDKRPSSRETHDDDQDEESDTSTNPSEIERKVKKDVAQALRKLADDLEKSDDDQDEESDTSTNPSEIERKVKKMSHKPLENSDDSRDQN